MFFPNITDSLCVIFWGRQIGGFPYEFPPGASPKRIGVFPLRPWCSSWRSVRKHASQSHGRRWWWSLGRKKKSPAKSQLVSNSFGIKGTLLVFKNPLFAVFRSKWCGRWFWVLMGFTDLSFVFVDDCVGWWKLYVVGHELLMYQLGMCIKSSSGLMISELVKHDSTN